MNRRPLNNVNLGNFVQNKFFNKWHSVLKIYQLEPETYNTLLYTSNICIKAGWLPDIEVNEGRKSQTDINNRTVFINPKQLNGNVNRTIRHEMGHLLDFVLHLISIPRLAVHIWEERFNHSHYRIKSEIPAHVLESIGTGISAYELLSERFHAYWLANFQERNTVDGDRIQYDAIHGGKVDKEVREAIYQIVLATAMNLKESSEVDKIIGSIEDPYKSLHGKRLSY